MPEMGIERGRRGTPQISLKQFEGEDFDQLINTTKRVALASSYAKSALRTERISKSALLRKRAVGQLTAFLPVDISERFIDALLSGRIGSRLQFVLKGKTEIGGFTVTDVDFSPKPQIR